MLGWTGSVELREKNIHTVLFVFRCKHEFLNQSYTWTKAALSLSAASCLFSACTWRTVSSAYICTETVEQTEGRSFINKLNRIGPSIDSWGTPMWHDIPFHKRKARLGDAHTPGLISFDGESEPQQSARGKQELGQISDGYVAFCVWFLFLNEEIQFIPPQ